MKKEEIKKEVISLIADTLEIEKENINEKSNLVSDLDVESLDLVGLVVAFEDKYNVEIPDSEIKNIQTVEDIISFIEKNV